MSRLLAVLTGIFVLALVALKWDRIYGFTPLLRVSETWYAHSVPAFRSQTIKVEKGTGGYDGQFYAQVALDPALTSPDYASALDNPTYRSRRILVPAVAWALGAGSSGAVLQLYCLLNVAAWLVFAWLLIKELPPGTSAEITARWLAIVLSVGVLESVRQSLVDLPALLLLLACVRATRAGKSGGVWAALGLLTKETQLVGIAAIFFKRYQPRQLIITLVLAAAPLIGWASYVFWRFRDVPAASNLGQANFALPFFALASTTYQHVQALLSGHAGTREVFGLLAVVAFFVQAGFVLRSKAEDETWKRVGLAYAVLGLFLGTAVWSGYWAAARALLPLCVAFNLVLAPGRRFWLVWAAGNLPLLHGVWRFL